jgi:hypothetical protein
MGWILTSGLMPTPSNSGTVRQEKVLDSYLEGHAVPKNVKVRQPSCPRRSRILRPMSLNGSPSRKQESRISVSVSTTVRIVVPADSGCFSAFHCHWHAATVVFGSTRVVAGHSACIIAAKLTDVCRWLILS